MSQILIGMGINVVNSLKKWSITKKGWTKGITKEISNTKQNSVIRERLALQNGSCHVLDAAH